MIKCFESAPFVYTTAEKPWSLDNSIFQIWMDFKLIAEDTTEDSLGTYRIVDIAYVFYYGVSQRKRYPLLLFSISVDLPSPILAPLSQASNSHSRQ